VKLQNKRAIITAAASGMGKAGVERFAKEGATVVAVDIDKAKLDEVVNAVKAAGGAARASDDQLESWGFRLG